MSNRSIDIMRWVAVASYALMSGSLVHDGVSVGDLITMTVVGAIAFVGILAADWINRAPRRSRDD